MQMLLRAALCEIECNKSNSYLKVVLFSQNLDWIEEAQLHLGGKGRISL